MKQTIRIIGGRYRGKKLTFPDSEGLRPTPDRVRETLFNWLMNDIQQTRCLDAFAGSGALGFEAFSRGAAEVCFIEHNKTAYHHLQATITHFNANHLTAIQTDACEFIRQTQRTFDIVFLDPPFNSNVIASCLSALSQSNVLQTGGLVYIESAHEITADQYQWNTLKQKKAGQVFYGLLKKKMT